MTDVPLCLHLCHSPPPLLWTHHGATPLLPVFRCGHPSAAEAFAAATAAWRGLRSSESASQLIAAVRQGAAELRGWRHLAGEPLRQASAPLRDGAASEDARQGAAAQHREGGGAAPEAPGRKEEEEDKEEEEEEVSGAPEQQPLSAAVLRGLPEKDLKHRVHALLLAAESREASFQKQTAAGAEDHEAPGSVPAAAKKRARKAMAKRRSNFVRPADPSKPTCHLHVANTGAEPRKPASEALLPHCIGHPACVIPPPLPFPIFLLVISVPPFGYIM